MMNNTSDVGEAPTRPFISNKNEQYIWNSNQMKTEKEWTFDNSIYNLQIPLHYIGELSLSQVQSSFASEYFVF